MKSTAFFFVLFALCLVACTKVSQLSPNTDSLSKNNVAKSASNANNGGYEINPTTTTCGLPGPSYIWVTSPYSNTANGLQKLNIQWAQVSGAANYRITVKNMTTNLYMLDVTPPLNTLMVAPNNQFIFSTNPDFSAFTTYEVTVSTKCNDGGIGGNVITNIIITGGPMLAVQDDLERPLETNTTPYQDYMKTINTAISNPNPFITFQSCAATTTFTSSFYTDWITRLQPQTQTTVSLQIKYANIVGTGSTSASDMVKVKLNVPNAQIGNFLAISEITSNNPTADLANTNWKIAKFLSPGAIAVEINKSKTYRIRLYSSSMNTYYNPIPGTDNPVNLYCSILN